MSLGALAPVGPGCHLLENLTIDCVEGMPCADGGGGDDTGVVGDPELGVLFSAGESDNAWVRRYSPTAEELNLWEGLADTLEHPGADDRYGGAVAWDPTGDQGVVTAGDKVGFLYADGSAVLSTTLDGAQIFDVAMTGDKVWLALGADLVRYDLAANPEVKSLFDGGLTLARGVLTVGDRVYVTDCVDGEPDLYTIDADTERVIAVEEGFSDNCGRGDNLFEGPDGEPWQCNGSGVLYRVGDLLDGTNTPRYTPRGLVDVRDCGYDPGSGAFYLYDGTSGLVRLLPDGTTESVWEPARNVAVGRANFYHAY